MKKTALVLCALLLCTVFATGTASDAPLPIPEMVIEDVPVPLSSGEKTLSAIITSDHPKPEVGEKVILTALVINATDIDVSYQWYINRGLLWEELPAERSKVFSYEAGSEFGDCRFGLSIIDEQGKELLFVERAEMGEETPVAAPEIIEE